MNEPPDLPATPSALPPKPICPERFPPPKPAGDWLRRLLACNPFYIASAALLLYGFYRVSSDTSAFTTEVSQLFFNYTALQAYELLLVFTAIVLARRRVWYDSTLLLGLENLLVLVPFIFISQAALIQTRLVWTLSLAGGLMAVARFSGLQRFIAELNCPARLRGMGLALLAANVALPVLYRLLHEHKVGTLPTWGAAYYTNEYAWLLLLPLLCGLVNWLPPLSEQGKLPPQRWWVPPGWLALWLAGTVVHLYCLGYVYDFPLRPQLVAPALWLLAWTARWRARDFLPGFKETWREGLLAAPLLAAFLAATEASKGVFLFLTALNLGLYGGLCVRPRERRVALHLLCLSLVAFIGGLPEHWGQLLMPEFTRAKCIGAGLAAYCLLWTVLSRNPKSGLLGALVSAFGVMVLLPEHPGTPHWAFQVGVAFLLLHSVRWVDAEQEGSAVLRALAALAWVAHTWVWMHGDEPAKLAVLVPMGVLAGYLTWRFLASRWGSLIIPVAAVLVLLASPASTGAAKVASAPPGLLAVVGSFALFAVGTLLAFTKRHWNKNRME